MNDANTDKETTPAANTGSVKLSTQDLIYLVSVIRRTVPKDFEDGKELTYSEALLLQVIQNSQQLQRLEQQLPPGIASIPGA